MPSAELDRVRSAFAGRYEVVGELGRGGMATVYSACDHRYDREVAIKVLQPDVAGSVGGERFLSEIRAVASLSHPHILPLHDSGEHEGFLWYVMPRVHGESLADRLASEGPLSLEEALRITKEVAGALGHAHAQGICHRDVKPSNILMSDGEAVLADFGIARALDQEGGAGLTRTGVVVGTPSYMSPEQSGSGKIDGRADQYSLACVLYEMLVGDPPFTGPSALVVTARHALEEVPSVRVARPAVPVEVERALNRALSKTPADRFPSMDAFARALEAPVTGWTTASPTPRRRGLRKVAVGAAAVLVLSLGAVAAILITGGGHGDVPGRALDPRRVAVGLLENHTGDPSLDQLGRIGADWLNEALHRSGVVEVVPALSAMQAARFVRERAQAGEVWDPVRSFAQETGAGVVVSGRYYILGDSLQFSVEVTDAIKSSVLARAEFNSSLDDLHGAIANLGDRVIGALALGYDDRLAGEVRGRRPPLYTAYEAFDEGMEYYLSSEWAQAVGPLERAHQIDTTFIMPLLYAAASQYNIDQWSEERLEIADSLLGVANDHREALPEYDQHWLDYQRATLRGDPEGALRAIRRAAEIAPASKASYNRAYAAQLTNRPAEAVEALQHLDPDHGPMRGWFPYWQMLTDNLHRLGRHDEEIEAARAARVRHPERVWSVRLLGEALAAEGKVGEIMTLVVGIDGLALQDELPGEALAAIGEELRFHGYPEAADTLVNRAVDWFKAQPPAIAADPDFQIARATTLQMAGRPREALALLDSLASAHTGADVLGFQGVLAATAGDEERARRIASELAARHPPRPTGMESLQRARIAALLGDEDAAVALLRQAYQEGYRPLRHPDISLFSLRDNPAFVELQRPRG